jgi:hypothetical protein
MTFVIAPGRYVVARSSNLLLDSVWVTPRGASSHGRHGKANGPDRDLKTRGAG